LQVQHFYKTDPAYGSGIARKLGLDIDAIIGKMQPSAAD